MDGYDDNPLTQQEHCHSSHPKAVLSPIKRPLLTRKVSTHLMKCKIDPDSYSIRSRYHSPSRWLSKIWVLLFITSLATFFVPVMFDVNGFSKEVHSILHVDMLSAVLLLFHLQVTKGPTPQEFCHETRLAKVGQHQSAPVLLYYMLASLGRIENILSILFLSIDRFPINMHPIRGFRSLQETTRYIIVSERYGV